MYRQQCIIGRAGFTCRHGSPFKSKNPAASRNSGIVFPYSHPGKRPSPVLHQRACAPWRAGHSCPSTSIFITKSLSAGMSSSSRAQGICLLCGDRSLVAWNTPEVTPGSKLSAPAWFETATLSICTGRPASDCCNREAVDGFASIAKHRFAEKKYGTLDLAPSCRGRHSPHVNECVAGLYE